MPTDTHKLLDNEGRALLLPSEVPDGAIIKSAHTATNGRVVTITDDVQAVQIKDRGYCLVARVTHYDGREERITSPIGLVFQNLTAPRSAKS